MRRIFAIFFAAFLLPFSLPAAELFDQKEPVQDGLNVFEISAVFSDIYEKLDSVKWGGKSIGVAIESLEKLSPSAHIAATDERVVLVWKDSIIANYPMPAPRNWKEYGQITTALVLKLRTQISALRNATDSALYNSVVGALVSGLDENGRYIYSKRAEIAEDGRILTSIGLEGARAGSGSFIVNGVYKGSPADNDGVRAGDMIVNINGQPVAQMSDPELAAAFSGFNSGTLKLGIAIPGTKDTKQIVLRRATVVLADADVVLRTTGQKAEGARQDQLLEIVIHKVSENSVAIVNEALATYKGATGIIFDLRGARGDDERAAAKLAGLFLGQVPVMRIVETGNLESEIVPGGDSITRTPVVVLMSGATRGTAEAIAAAFYENGRGILVGTPTAGSARIATKIDLENGGALELLNKSLKTGQGRALDGRGVFPLVCLSNIRNQQQQGAFFLNIINGDFRAQDFNAAEPDVAAIRKGCPQITSGADEDAASAAVAVKILTDKKVYNKLAG
ncbi:MAG: PDZ domain-containing protein [Rickettsiales bacterium]|jgi:carboxyl-terminal processing protease|nr:PDZ domain-containing protein [Rickettsiales bacterium]